MTSVVGFPATRLPLFLFPRVCFIKANVEAPSEVILAIDADAPLV